ncbi:MAG: NrdH-redoxin [Sorangiineae bacterium]|nr:NrdH-redoxin [Polyangiaceae bacterium]MEB2321104.1 NrdH-redoxin [Sorangiineae bacterium]
MHGLGRVLSALFALVALLAFTRLALAEPECGESACAPFDDATAAGAPGRAAPPKQEPALTFFWGVGCPRCEDAKPFVVGLPEDFPGLAVESVEVRRDRAGRERFLRVVDELGIEAPGIPLFVYQGRYHIGFARGVTEAGIREMLRGAASGSSERGAHERLERVRLPGLGEVEPTAMSLPAFTLMVGLVDGINPCAMWVLLVLLGILLRIRSRRRLLLFGGVFVLASGVVYFLFMTAWHGLFQLMGLSRAITIGLGAIILLMGLVNLKELIWFKRGVSLTIPDKVKPKLYRRMRGAAEAASLPAALLAVSVLAVLVNLVELGCTLGLPAIYTRILALRTDLTLGARYGYLVLYNVAYVVPLAVIVVVYALTLHRFALEERGARVLKGVSGALLVGFGLLFILAPGLLA